MGIFEWVRSFFVPKDDLPTLWQEGDDRRSIKEDPDEILTMIVAMQAYKLDSNVIVNVGEVGRTYALIHIGKEPALACFFCKNVSQEAHSVQNLYCMICKTFHKKP